MKRVKTAVMHCHAQQHQKIIDVGIRVRDKLYANPALYGSPPIAAAIFKVQLNSAIAAQAAAIKGGVKATSHRNAEVTTLFTMLNPVLILYVIRLYKGQADKLLASGFDTSNDPLPRSAPRIPVIKRVEMTDLADHIAKVFLGKIHNPLETKRGLNSYLLQVAVGNRDEESFQTILMTTNSRRLLIPNLQRGKETFIRVCAMNARGISAWSDVISFYPN
jgi:hypothetical protein